MNYMVNYQLMPTVTGMQWVPVGVFVQPAQLSYLGPHMDRHDLSEAFTIPLPI